MIYPLADYDVQIFADPALVVAAPGEETVQGHVRHYQLSGARSFAFLASPDYQLIQQEATGLTVRSYYLPDYAGAAQAAADVASRALTLYSDLYGPYPSLGLVVAQNAYLGSMEYSGLVSLSDQAYVNYQESPRAQLVTLTAHEVAHQWWYGAVGNDQVHEPWLDEAFAKYSEALYYERYHPELVQWWWDAHITTHNPAGPLDRTIYDFEDSSDYFHMIYGQGARFLQDLRVQMGDAAFFEFVRTYRGATEGTLAGREDFFAVLRTRTGEDVAPLIRRYFQAHTDIDELW
jgi:aminopeptidase N